MQLLADKVQFLLAFDLQGLERSMELCQLAFEERSLLEPGLFGFAMATSELLNCVLGVFEFLLEAELVR